LGLYYSINLSICDEKLVSSIKQSTQQKEGGSKRRTKKEEKQCIKFFFLKKNQGPEPIHQKYKANESTSRHNLKKKQKKTINKNKVKTLCK